MDIGMNDDELLYRARAGDAEAKEALFRWALLYFTPRASKSLRKDFQGVVDREETEEFVQVVLFEAIRSLHEGGRSKAAFESPSAFRGHIILAIKNRIIDWKRAAVNGHRVDGQTDGEEIVNNAGHSSGLSGWGGRDEDLERLETLDVYMKFLSEEDQEYLNLYHFIGLSAEEIVERKGVVVGTVNRRLRKARGRLGALVRGEVKPWPRAEIDGAGAPEGT
ncbi:MAG TPA: sigma-70 family RNA polymerase sigma factor [Isosphaeraceae bacterium]|jgi:RNA polymerase sigma factor (sigma-70 family)|nr:sigma-70 family RNA polymerase sigma factor [Isosphaeraceae bacterium]